jgi:hypothetical protein
MTSPEHPNDQEQSYWTADVAIGEGRFYDDRFTIRLALHEQAERYFGRSEIFPLTANTGSRVYFHAKPYILLPDINLQIGLFPEPRGDVIGKVETVNWEGMRHEVLGNAQAWFYPQERALVLWECFIEERHRRPDPLEDANQQMLWAAFEQLVMERSLGVEKVYTSWEDLYERPLWKRFVEGRGYHQVAPALFQKDVAAAERGPGPAPR